MPLVLAHRSGASVFQLGRTTRMLMFAAISPPMHPMTTTRRPPFERAQRACDYVSTSHLTIPTVMIVCSKPCILSPDSFISNNYFAHFLLSCFLANDRSKDHHSNRLRELVPMETTFEATLECHHHWNTHHQVLSAPAHFGTLVCFLPFCHT
jgi:hypothetical protein